jgi:hypothetical protein
MPPSGAAQAQEAAQELNVNTRFGRMEMAIERVAVKEREAWLATHKAWGGKIHIADVEMAGVKAKGDEEAEVIVRVAWYLAEQLELRSTTLKQHWKDVNGDMMLVGETRIDGDLGLLGEKIPPPPAAASDDAQPKEPARFPTIRINGDNGAVFREP